MVLIHGGGSTIQSTFGRILPLLAQHYEVIAVELQAHGHSGYRNAPESFEQDADDVAALLKHLNIIKTFVFGFSNGGSTTLQIAIRHPGIVDKIVVASADFRRDGFVEGFFEGMQHATLESMPQGLQDAYLKINADTTALLNMFNRDKARMIAFKDWDISKLQSIRCPALVIASDKDVVTVEHTIVMSKLIKHSELVILPGYHGAFLVEACTAVPNSKLPEITVEIIKEFLKK